MNKGKIAVSMTLIILITGLLSNNVNAEATMKRLAGQTRYDTC